MQLVEAPRWTLRQGKVIVRVPIERAAESCRPIPERPVSRYQQHVLTLSLKMMTINFGIVKKRPTLDVTVTTWRSQASLRPSP